ncbi:transcriptional regulator prz1 [Electrophorus electricus]|uniref:transcriptional regulator prz1 n=1 Tax=Electrophorus electricus TaxID=8005 RepID=UPI0015D0914B|nr:transcriptional regulator prz1 [Electrophorus electricus]XP_026854917.2 transcriptional regulator prz1 [Electrophorus electricus]
MEFEPNGKIPQVNPSISGVSQEQSQLGIYSLHSYSKKGSPRQDSYTISNYIPTQSNQAIENDAVTAETKMSNVQISSKLKSNIMPDNILMEMNEPITKVINLNSNFLPSDLPDMAVQRQSSPQIDSPGIKTSDGGVSPITKEEVKIQDVAKVTDSDDIILGKMENYDTLKKTGDCVNKEMTECSQHYNNADCNAQIPFHKRPEGLDVAMSKTSAEEVTEQQEVFEALDLSLPKKQVRENKEKCKWVIDSGYEGSLFMEVDEIEDDSQHVEVEQDEDTEECWFPWRNEDNMSNFHMENWKEHPSVSHAAMPSPPCASFLSPDPKDTLLIDDQGIPYTLTPDGQKVPQIDLSEVPKASMEQINPGFVQSDIDSSGPVQDSDSYQEFLPNPSLNSSPVLSTETSEATLRVEKKSSHDSTVQARPTALSVVSSLSSVPIQIVASNTGSNTPILLLPPSQLQTLSSSASNANPGIMALSLPFALAQNPQSSPVFLVLSTPQVSCGIQSSSLSGQFAQISSASAVALSSPSGSLSLKPEPDSCTTTTNLSGQNKPCKFSSSLPTSPNASSSTSSVTSTSPTKQLKTDICSDTPTSFREALLRLAVSAEQKDENRPECTVAPSALTPSSCSEATQSHSPSTTNGLEEHCNNEQALSPTSDPASISVDQTDSLLSPISTEDLLPQSSTSSPPASPIFPTNHPKNQDSQALGPRRILYCQYCPRVFYYLSDLERHSITHSQNKPHVCQLCGKAFKRSSHLERHKHIHTGQRNFVCQLCPRRFREAAELTRHQRVHTGEKPFQCLLCHMRFAERNTLRRHTKRKHQGQQQEAMNMKVKPETEGVSVVGVQGQQEENAEWYSSAVTEMESDNDTGGE